MILAWASPFNHLQYIDGKSIESPIIISEYRPIATSSAGKWTISIMCKQVVLLILVRIGYYI